MNNLQIFENEKFGTIRSLKLNGEPYFVGKDVARVLGYGNPRDALKKHVDVEDKGVAKCDTLGGTQELTVINESGLYSLIFSSKLPKAKEFKHWVTSEVLPSIRKTGSYGQLDVEKIVGMTVSETIKQLMPLLQQNTDSLYADGSDTVEEIVVRKRCRRLLRKTTTQWTIYAISVQRFLRENSSIRGGTPIEKIQKIIYNFRLAAKPRKEAVSARGQRQLPL